MQVAGNVHAKIRREGACVKWDKAVMFVLSSCSHLQENVKGLQGEIRRLKAELDKERMEAERLKVTHTPAQASNTHL